MAAEYVARIGERIRTRREELGLTQEEVARRLPGKVTGQRVSLWERGEHQPRADSLEAVAKALDVPVTYFLAAAPDKTETPDLVATMGPPRSSEDRLEAVERLVYENFVLLAAIAAKLDVSARPGAVIALQGIEQRLADQASQDPAEAPPGTSRRHRATGS